MNKKLYASLAVIPLIGALMPFVMKARATEQEATTSIFIAHFKNEPVEIVSIKVGSKLIAQEEVFTPTANWTEQLEITIKNVSERPVSYVLVHLAPTGPFPPYNCDYAFGNHPDEIGIQPIFIQPQATVKLTRRALNGDSSQLDRGPARITIQSVFWDNDKWVMWNSGRLLRRVNEEKTEYVPQENELSRYVYPKGYEPSPEFRKALAAPTPATQPCNVKFVSNTNLNCTRNCPHGGNPKCYVSNHNNVTTSLGCDNWIFFDECDMPCSSGCVSGETTITMAFLSRQSFIS